MNQRTAQKKKTKGKNLILTFLLLLSIPVFVIGLLQDKNFDIRNQAFNSVEVSSQNPCVITFPNVNPYSLKINSTFRIQVDAVSTSLGIQSITINEGGKNLFTKTFDDIPKQISESFLFTPETAKAYEIKGTMEDINKKTYECIISSTYDVEGVRAIANNSKPVFTSFPKNSNPSQNIKEGEIYEYTLTAEDLDNDTINYSFSFTPNNLWLKPTVIEDGGNGKLIIKFKGSTNEAASYLANIFIHDGYSNHLASQSWVISVNPKENDIPQIKIIDPIEALIIKKEDSFTVSWDAQDNNHIERFEVYISQNPTNEKSWITINKNIAHNITSQSIDTRELKDGTYKVIVRAVDNQTPNAIGMDISEEIVISRGQTQGREPDDQISLNVPQVINFSPTATDEIKNSKPTIKASLVASINNTIDEDSILIKLNNRDITEKIKINRISNSEYTVIYLPEENLEKGTHKVEVSFKEIQGQEVSKDWTFTITGEEKDPNTINILGYSISKRIVYIVAGGIGLLLLAIFIPMIIFAVWKDTSTTKNTISKTSSIPQTSSNEVIHIPTQQPPPLEESVEPTPISDPVYTAVKPETNLTTILNDIDDIRKEDSPPEPVL